MPLAAAQVIDALAARLGTVAATAGRVYVGRGWPIAEGELPAWRVIAGDEQAEHADLDGLLHRHQLEVRCEARCQATADVDDTMHSLASAGLQALFAAPAPYALQITAITRSQATEGEARLGVLGLVVRCEFFADASAPDTILSD